LRTWLLVAVLGAALTVFAAACGDDDSNDTNAGKPAAMREFTHAFGTVMIPAEPQRVVAINVIAFEAALLIDPGRLIAVGDHSTASELYASLIRSSDATAIESFEVDIEGIAALEPDLILDGAFEGGLFSGADINTLSEVAPVVAFDFGEPYDGAWKDYYLFFADALNLRDEAEATLAEYEAGVASLRDRLGGNDGATEISVSSIRVRDGSNIENFRTETSFTDVILDDIGFDGPLVSDEFSLERLREADADHVFIWSANSDVGEVLANLQNPLWDSLDATRNGNLHQVEGHWFGFGPAAAMLVLDDIAEALGANGASSSWDPCLHR
jgi:iron complex transport system substrate-binding protein